MAACPECGEFVGPGAGGMTWGYGYAQDEEGNWIEGSEVTIGLFHPDCWGRWKEKHPVPDDAPQPPRPPDK